MAITYPLNTPTTIGIESISLRAVNAVSTSQSPFTYKQQVVDFGGQRWEASVSIPSVRRDLAAEWVTMLVALKGPVGTFLLGDPDYALPRGNCAGGLAFGSAGDDTVSLDLTGQLLAGDYIQLGDGSDIRLYKLLEDTGAGGGTVSIWPNLRQDYLNAPITIESPKGTFRLKQNMSEWSINNASAYGISFEAVEVIN
jgi:hypothetical protein